MPVYREIITWIRMFSESELAILVFLAFVSFVIVFLGCIMLGRGRIDSSAGRRPDEKKIKRVTRYYCRDSQHKKRRRPEENDDDEPYNRRGTLFRYDYIFDVITSNCCSHIGQLVVLQIVVLTLVKSMFALFPKFFDQLTHNWAFFSQLHKLRI